MAKVDKDVKVRVDALTDEQLDRKVDHLRQTIPALNTELDYAARVQKDRRRASLQAKIDEAKRTSR